MAEAPRDANRISTLLAVSNVDGVTPVVVYADPTTHRLLVDLPSSTGTVTSVSVSTANGVSGSVATATTTPAITLALGDITPTSVGIGVVASQKLEVHSVAGLPAASGITQNGIARLSNATNDLATDFGQMVGAPFSAWIQNTNKINLASYYPLALNPSGGNVGVGCIEPGALFDVGLAGTTLGVIRLAGNTSGNVSLQPNAVAGTNIVLTLPATTDTLVAKTTTDTLTNKRITKRVLPLSAGSATPAINTNLYDVVHITAQNAAITSFTSSLSGTPVDGDTLRISITDDGTGRALTWGASFEASTVALPTTTVASTRLDVGFFWNTETSKWRCVASA